MTSTRGGEPVRGRALPALVLLVAALVSLGAFLHCNGFKEGFHPDEPSKARQLLSGEYNLHHPQLMLRGVALVNWLQAGSSDGEVSFLDDDVERWLVMVRGRTFSALMTAVAVGLLGWLAFAVGTRAAGRPTGVLASTAAVLFLATHPGLVVNAHYFKEDATLLGATAIWLVVAAAYLQTRGWAWLVAAGVAAGLVASAKAVGAASLAITLVATLAIPPATPIGRGGFARRLGGAAAVLATAAAIFALVNLSAFTVGADQIDHAVGLARYQAVEGHTDGLRYDGVRLSLRVLGRWPAITLLASSAAKRAARIG